MKKLLIATKNIDKYKIVTSMLDKILLNKFSYSNLTNLNIDYDVEEMGTITERAVQKAKTYWKYLIENNLVKDFSAVIGVDDGIGLSKDDGGNPNSKELTDKILSGKFIEQNKNVWTKRAFAIYNDNLVKSCLTSIPLTFLGNHDNTIREDGKYPLSKVLAPINGDKTMSELPFTVAIDYTFKYSEEKLTSLLESIKNL